VVFEQLGLVGCGLMGGSFALALKRAGLVRRVVGFSPSAASRAQALALGVIDTAATSAADAVRGADLVLLAVPVAATEATLAALAPSLSDRALVMDVGSTKGDVLAAAELALGPCVDRFVPAHPIAGKELSGVAHADPSLYAGCQVILTPSSATAPGALAQADALWRALGCRVRQMSAQAHDAAFAAVSHLPHLLAFAMMNSITAQPQAAELLSLAGSGFRDFTRIAASDPAVWRDIFLANRTQVLAQVQWFRDSLDALERSVSSPDPEQIAYLLAQASDARAAWQLGAATKN
jgi:prephenate dehydrogenase